VSGVDEHKWSDVTRNGAIVHCCVRCGALPGDDERCPWVSGFLVFWTDRPQRTGVVFLD